MPRESTRHRVSRIQIDCQLKPATVEPVYTILVQDRYVAEVVSRQEALEWFARHLETLAITEPLAAVLMREVVTQYCDNCGQSHTTDTACEPRR